MSATSNTSGASTRPGRLRRGYVFAVSALAMFAVALMVQRDMGADYSGSATLTADASAGLSQQAVEKSARGLEKLLTTAESIHIAASDAGIPIDTNPAADNTHKAGMTTVDGIRRRLSIVRTRGADGTDSVCVTYASAERQPTLRLVNALAQQAVRQQQRADKNVGPREQSVAAAEQAAALAAQDLADARRKRDEFAAANEKLLAAQLPAEGPSLPAAAEPSEAQHEADAATRQRVRQLDGRLQELKGVRRRLLDTMTPEHPHYQLVRDQISQLQAEIDEANRSLKPARPANPTEAVDQQVHAMRQKQQALIGELGTLERGVVEAKARHETLVRDATDARRLAASQPVGELWQIAAAEVAQRVPRRTTIPSVLIAVAIAIVAGSATLLIGGAVRTIDRAADVTNLLSLRLLGALADKGESVPGRSRSRHRPSRWVLLVSEATLALFLVAMMIGAISNHDFAAQIAADPLSGLAEGVRRLPAVFGGPVL